MATIIVVLSVLMSMQADPIRLHISAHRYIAVGVITEHRYVAIEVYRGHCHSPEGCPHTTRELSSSSRDRVLSTTGRGSRRNSRPHVHSCKTMGAV